MTDVLLKKGIVRPRDGDALRKDTGKTPSASKEYLGLPEAKRQAQRRFPSQPSEEATR